ncbi:MAG: FAD-dependent oxidoreductase [Coriobacteriia bacterium]|nr:FAD-dependent oxidoreductase [Coriobacteriia bacterium]
MRVAIVGTGVGGLGSAWLLSPNHTVDVYEAESRLGGHACTVDLTVGGVGFPADTGFMVFNQRTYPNLIRFFERLDVEWQESDMSFSVQLPAENVEWSGDSLNSVFAQRKNIANPRFLKMLADIVRFSRNADRLLADPSLETMTLGEMLEREGYSGGFTDWYLIPMGDAIWSAPPGKMLDYPAATFMRFCDKHGLLHITGKPKWRSVVGGSRTYVEAAARSFSGEVHTAEPVEAVSRTENGVRVSTPRRTEVYDAAIIASHPPQTLEMLGAGATDAETEILGVFSYWPNEVVIHTDPSFLPKRRRAWAAWNWYSACCETAKDKLVLSYYLNRLQRLPVETPVIETLNEHKHPAADSELLRMVFDHPMYSADAIAAQRRLGEIQGVGNVWYAGAWTRYGFHEDGMLSAVSVAERLGAALPWAEELDSSRTRVLGGPEVSK